MSAGGMAQALSSKLQCCHKKKRKEKKPERMYFSEKEYV
jgi:hypothetical protein